MLALPRSNVLLSVYLAGAFCVLYTIRCYRLHSFRTLFIEIYHPYLMLWIPCKAAARILNFTKSFIHSGKIRSFSLPQFSYKQYVGRFTPLILNTRIKHDYSVTTYSISHRGNYLPTDQFCF